MELFNRYSNLFTEFQFLQNLRPPELSATSFTQLRLRRPDSYEIKLPTLADLRTIVINFLLFLLPSQVSRTLSRKRAGPVAAGEIAALDGLRGIACLIVFNEHFSANFSRAFLHGYGIENHSTFIQFPFIRTFWCGSAMVAIFFVISGYVLSYKSLKLMRAKNTDQLYSTLGSASLRRSLRLYIPSIAAVLICGVLSWLGVFDRAAEILRDPSNGLTFHENTPPRFDSLATQMWDASREAFNMFRPFDWGKENVDPGDYDMHLWTVNVEFRASLVLYFILFVAGRLRAQVRLTLVGIFIFAFVITDRRDLLLFLSGMVIAELDLIRKERLGKTATSGQENLELVKDGERNAWLVLFFLGYYLTSAPVYGAEKTPGYRVLTTFVPKNYRDAGIAVQAGGAVLLVWSVANSSKLKPIFINPAASYLGKISFALYLVHGNVIKSLLYTIMPWLLRFTGGYQYMTGFLAAWMIGLVLVLPLTLWLSDLFWRTIDLPSVSFAKWLEYLSVEEKATEVKEDVEMRMVANGNGH